MADRPGIRVLPGLLLCIVVTAAAFAIQSLELDAFGRAWIDALVLAILIGVVIRTLWTPGPQWQPGITFSAKLVLEIAVVLLGASISAAAIMVTGLWLLVGIFAIVGLMLALGYALGRLFGLSQRLAILVACGNAICGNSAIMAVAPIIGADSRDVASSIAFSAVLGLAVVLGLPLIGFALGMEAVAFGTLAGLTVYAVPQVIAAAAPFGATAIQYGTLVKLVRVLALGPVCLVLGLIAWRFTADDPADAPKRKRPAIGQLVPWFVIGFIVMIVLRSLGAFPDSVLEWIGLATKIMTVVAMAGLGLGVDIRTVARAGSRVVATVTVSLAALIMLALGLIWLLGLV